MESFLFLLKKYEIEYLVDVRSIPHSKHNSQFSKSDLEFFLSHSEIKYVFMGDLLGGRPTDEECYNEEGKVDYQKVNQKRFYQLGIERLKKAFKKKINIVLMCSESNPAHCHRSKLIGMSLIESIDEKIFLSHIDENGNIKDQATVMNELNKGRGPIDLFNDINLTSRKSYIR